VQTSSADGSYQSVIYPSLRDQRHQTNGVAARVIDYHLEGVPDAEPLYRLVTTLLDPVVAPAVELARRALSRAVGDRNGAGRTQDPLARRPDRAPQQDAGHGPAGV